jgi:hypothetical protein
MSNAFASRASRPPIRPRPIIASLRQAADQRQDQPHRMFRHRARVHARGRRQSNPLSLQRGFLVLIRARTDRLNEPQFVRVLDQTVVPHPRREDDVRLTDPAIEVRALTDLEIANTGVQRIERRLHLIRGVREADGQVLAGRQHAVCSGQRRKSAPLRSTVRTRAVHSFRP